MPAPAVVADRDRVWTPGLLLAGDTGGPRGGPCIGAQNSEQYRATIQGLMDFLEGKSTAATLRQIRDEMADAEWRESHARARTAEA